MESKVPTPTPVPRQTLNIVNKTQLKTRARRVFSQNHIWPEKSLNFLLLKGIGRYFLYFVYIIMCLHLCLQQDTNPNSFHLHSSPPLLQIVTILCRTLLESARRQHLHLVGSSQQHRSVPVQVPTEPAQPQCAVPKAQRYAAGVHVLRMLCWKTGRRGRNNPDGDLRNKRIQEPIFQSEQRPCKHPDNLGDREIESRGCRR